MNDLSLFLFIHIPPNCNNFDDDCIRGIRSFKIKMSDMILMENKDIEKILEKLNDTPYHFYQDNKYAQPNFQNPRLNCEDDKFKKRRQIARIERLKSEKILSNNFLTTNSLKNQNPITRTITDIQERLVDEFINQQLDFCEENDVMISRDDMRLWVLHNIDFNNAKLVEKEDGMYLVVEPKLRDDLL